MKFSDLKEGMKASFTKSFTDEDVKAFARISGDVNPIHIDDDAAAASIFGKRVVHGILVTGLISAVLGNRLPGQGTIYLGQDSSFMAPVFLGDEITAEVEVFELRPDKKIAKLSTTCTNRSGKQVLKGTAVVKLAE
ncbi:MAG: MaoC family dehydratase [Clostridiales bacterium]|jgi:3-hydroxybutyryl-CoA dehydratase|nr:MaoC family dehydratase [Clostridiales bacterium]